MTADERVELSPEEREYWEKEEAFRRWMKFAFISVALLLIVTASAASLKFGAKINCAKSRGEYIQNGWVGACLNLSALGHCTVDGDPRIYYEGVPIQEVRVS